MTLTTINLAALGQTINLTSEVTGTLPIANGGTNSTSTTFVNAASNVTGTLPIANGGTALTSGFKNAGTYSLHAVADYVETDGYTTTASSNQFTCSDQSCTLTSSGTSDVFLIHASLNGYSDADSNGYGLYMVHSSTSDFSSGTATTLQTGRYGQQLMSGAYKNTTGLAKLTGLAAGAWYFRLYAMIQRPSSGTISLNVDAYATSGSVRHGVVVQQYKVN
tara:strand:- start:12 stop:671 length:660 start_codon:yes stop_codon:yes gene_type:complete